MTYSCNAGYVMSGTNVTTCLATGSWNSVAPVCIGDGLTPTSALVGHCNYSTITVSGLYYVAVTFPSGPVVLTVYCRVYPDGTKWLMFQRRTDTTDFYRNWSSYSAGFGTPSTDNSAGSSFWLGLETLHQMTRVGAWQLRVDLYDFTTGLSAYTVYGSFAIGPNSSFYNLSVARPAGTAGDAMGGHSGRPFSTYDVDNDASSANCALMFQGAWWYVACYASNLNGVFSTGCHSSGIVWCGLMPNSALPWTGDSTPCAQSTTPVCQLASMKSWMLLTPAS